MTARRKLGLFLVSFAAYMLLGSREPPWTDAKPIYAVAQSIVKRGELDAGMTTELGRNGKHFAIHPLITTLIHVPGAALENVLAKRYPTAGRPIQAIACHLGPAAVGAAACLLFALLLLDMGLSARLALTGAFLFGGTTLVAVYARSPYSEMVQTAAFLGFYLYLLRLVRWPSTRTALAFGAFAGLLVNTKVVFVLALPGAAAFAGVLLWRRHGRAALLRACGYALLGGAPFLFMLLAYNALRTGSPFNNGYPSIASDKQYTEQLWVGLWGLFLSPGKSLFLYSPPLLLGLVALPRLLVDRCRDWLWAALVTAGPVVWLYARILAWHGDWAWGPRYLVFTVPLFLMPALIWLPQLARRRRQVAVAALAGLGALGLWVQILGGMFYWDHFIRIDYQARPQWLGNPNRAGAASKDRGGWCHPPCFEDQYGLNWLPAFSPVAGHAWLLRHVPAGHAWDEARLDAPWTRYTSLPIDAANAYQRTRVDWWYLDFRHERRKAGFILFAGWLAMGALGIFFLRRPGQQRKMLGHAPELQRAALDADLWQAR